MYTFLALLAGVLSAVQSRANGQLSVDVHNPFGAAIASNLIGWIILWFFLVGRKREREGFWVLVRAVRTGELPWWNLLAGAAGAFYVSTQSLAVPKVGVAIFTICVIGGQTAASLLVDRIGFSTNGKQHITWYRIFTAVMTMVAVTVAVYPEFGRADFKILTILLSLAVGIVTSFQFALNSKINHVTNRSMVTTWVNFFVGSCFIAVALVIDLAKGGSISPLPYNPWVYVGGPCGLIFIAVAANVIKSMGVLNFVLFVVTGQLVGALLLDWLLPAQKGALSAYLIVGTGITLGSMALARYLARSQSIEEKV